MLPANTAATGTVQAPGISRRVPAQPGAAGVQAVQTGAGRQLVRHRAQMPLRPPLLLQVGPSQIHVLAY